MDDAADLAGEMAHERDREAAEERAHVEARRSFRGEPDPFDSDEEYDRFDVAVWGPLP